MQLGGKRWGPFTTPVHGFCRLDISPFQRFGIFKVLVSNLQLVVTAFLGKPILAKWGSASSAFFAGETGEVSHLREMTKIQLISSFRIMTIIAYSHEIPG
jgi:hypothetical protein